MLPRLTTNFPSSRRTASLPQEFKGEEEGDVFAAEERSDAAAAAAAAEAERRKAVPGLMNPYEAPGADLDDL